MFTAEAHPIPLPVGVGLGLSVAGLVGILVLLWLLVRRKPGDYSLLVVILALIFSASITLRLGHYLGWWS